MADRRNILCYLSFSVFGAVISLCGIIAFSILDNTWGEFWCFLSASYAVMNVYLLYFDYLEILEEHYNINVLQNINCFATISTIVFSGAFIWYIFEIIYYNLPTLPIDKSYPIIAVWCFMSVKWALALSFCTRRQIKELSNSGRPLLQT